MFVETQLMFVAFSLLSFRLSGTNIPDLVVSVASDMWLELHTDESINSMGFKLTYQGAYFFYFYNVFQE